MTTNPQHALAVSTLNIRLVIALAAFRCHVRGQSPVTLLPRDEPEPDLAIVTGLPADYAQRHPSPADVTCLIEVAGTSLERDRTVKQRIYAAAGIPQYVIVNLVDSRVEVLEEPASGKGRYRRRTQLARGEEIALLLPDVRPAAEDHRPGPLPRHPRPSGSPPTRPPTGSPRSWWSSRPTRRS